MHSNAWIIRPSLVQVIAMEEHNNQYLKPEGRLNAWTERQENPQDLLSVREEGKS